MAATYTRIQFQAVIEQQANISIAETICSELIHQNKPHDQDTVNYYIQCAYQNGIDVIRNELTYTIELHMHDHQESAGVHDSIANLTEIDLDAPASAFDMNSIPILQLTRSHHIINNVVVRIYW